MRIVLDTNSLIQCVAYHSVYRSVWQSVLSGQNALCVTNEILFEYEEILGRYFSPQFADAVISAILESKHVVRVNPNYHFNLITADPDDNKFVDCAIQANARYIVTNDHHYDILRQIDFPKVGIIKLMDFLLMIHG
jgi:putative PIN family toxin of toxin-antitoxin system